MKSFLLSLLLVLIIIGTWSFSYVFIFEDQLAEHRDLLEIRLDQNCIHRDLTALGKPKKQKKQKAAIQTLRKKLRARVPKTPQTAELLDRVNNLASREKLSIEQFEIGISTVKADYSIMPINLSIEGSFPKVIRFMREITLSNRLLALNLFKYEKGHARLQYLAYFGDWTEEIQKKSRQLNAQDYKCDEHRISAQIKKALKPTKNNKTLARTLKRNPFITSSTHMSDQGVHLVGIIKIDRRWIALLEDNLGAGQAVTVGDRVLDGILVKDIARDAVTMIGPSGTREITWKGESS